jgi:purine-cytosine permease-like protein
MHTTKLANHDIKEHEDHKTNDYARTRVPAHAQRSAISVFTVLFGVVTAFFFPFVGGLSVHLYGATAAWIGLLISFLAVSAFSLITCHAAAREGLTAELMTRGCGFGLFGSNLTTVIYGTTFILLTATEAQILATNINQVWELPNIIWYIFVALIFVPMLWNGISSLATLLQWSIPIYLVLMGAAIWVAIKHHGGVPDSMFTALPEGAVGGVTGVLGVIGLWSPIVGLNPMEISDYNRFVGHKKFMRKSILTVILPFALMFLVAAPLGIFFTLMVGEYNPGIYIIGFIGLGLGVALAWTSQIRINLTNIHIGSIALASAAKPLGAMKLGRRFFTLLILASAVLLMWIGILGKLSVFLQWNGIFLLSWVGCLIADLLIVRKTLNIVNGPIEYRGNRLRKYNPVGITALVTASLIGTFIWLLADNVGLQGLSAYIAFVIAVFVHTTMAILTKGKYYFSN